MVYPISKILLMPLFKLYTKNIQGLKNLPKNTNFIVTANQNSWWDPIALTALIIKLLNKKIHFMANPRFWFLGDTICRKWVGCIPVYKNDKGESALREALRLLKKNKIIGIFPKAMVRNKNVKAKTGIARLALQSKKPVVPIGLIGVDKIAPGESILPRKFGRITINIGKPMFFNEYYGKPYNKKTLRHLTDKIVINIEDLLEQ